tara:strand:- start:148 stop:423 length:276 start_codon:yes stop_codon:yes gene_type:complete
MGGDQAANVLATIKKEKMEKDGKRVSAQELEELKQPIMDKYEKEGHPYYASSRLWDDGVINPTETRIILIKALQAVNNMPSPDRKFPVFRM